MATSRVSVGLTCKYGHVRSEIGTYSNNGCKQCAKDRSAKRRVMFPDKHRAAQKKHYLKYKLKRLANTRKWEKNNPTKLAEQQRKVRYKKLGVTIDQYEKMLVLQNGGCALCGKLPGKQRLAVEHDHKSGRVRGACCFRCNKYLIGRHTNKDIPRLKKLIAYLESEFDGREI